MRLRTLFSFLAVALASGFLGIAQEKTAETPKPRLLNGFEDSRSWDVTQKQAGVWDNSEGASASLRVEMLGAKEGRNCCEFDYEFATDKADAVQLSLREPLTLPDAEGKLPPPDRIGLWVYGDLSGHTVRYRFTDNKGKLWEMRFPGAETLDWTGWRYIEGPLAAIEGVAWPIRFGSLDIVDSHPEFRGRGAVKLDGLGLRWLSEEEKRAAAAPAAEGAPAKDLAAAIPANLETLQNRLVGIKAKLVAKGIAEDPAGKALLDEVGKCEADFIAVRMDLPPKELLHEQAKIGCRMLALAAKIDSLLSDLAIRRVKAREQKFVVFRRPLMAEVLPDTIPGADEVVQEIKVSAAPGEIRAVSIAVFAASSIEGLLLSATDLKCGKETLPAAAVRIRSVSVWYQQRLSAQAGPYVDAVRTPELIEDANGIFVPPYASKQFWLTVQIPKDMPPGHYEGKLILKSHNLKADELGLKVTVYPFELQSPPDKVRGMFYAFAGVTSNSPASRENPPTRLADFRDMAEHGMDTIIDTKPFDYFTVEGEGEGAKLNFAGVTAVMEAFKKSGLSGRLILFPFRGAVGLYHKARTGAAGTIYDAEYRESYKRVVKSIEEKFTAEGWPTPYDYTFDEPPDFDKCLPFFETLREAKAHVAASDFRFEFGQKMIPYCSLFIYSGGLLFENNPNRDGNMKRFLEMRPKFPDVTWGAYIQTWYDGPYGWEWVRLTFGVPFQKSELQSVWGHIYMAPSGDPFIDFDGGGHKDSMTVYPAPAGNIATIQWEMAREGANDARYLYTLQQKIEEVRKTNAQAAETAEKTLKEVLGQYDEFDVRATMERLKPSDYEDLRTRVAEAILELTQPK